MPPRFKGRYAARFRQIDSMKKFTEFFAALSIVISVTILTSSAVFAASKSVPKTALPAGSVFKFSSGPQIYYVAENGTAYGVPDEATFFSWFASFNKVQVYPKNSISNSISKSILTIKPGARVVKFGNKPELYTVSKGARLRWIRNEESLVGLFGDKWQNYFVTLPESRRNDYILGADIKKAGDFDRTKERTGITPNDDLVARKVVVPTKTYAKAPVVVATQLKSLTENSTSALVPGFSSFITSYRLTVPYREDKITLTPTANSADMNITVRENEVPSGKPISFDLPLGDTNVPIVVKTNDNDFEKYYLVITRNKPSENTYLNSLTENLSGSLTPKFTPYTRDYVITATGKEEVITVVPKLQDSLARMFVDGKEYASGVSFKKGLEQGNTNVVQIVVMSESGVSERYTITIKKPN